jgi:hypothetical protein
MVGVSTGFPPAVPCPSPAPRLTFPPLAEPKLPSQDQLRVALSATAPGEAGVRAALAALALDSAIRVDPEVDAARKAAVAKDPYGRHWPAVGRGQTRTQAAVGLQDGGYRLPVVSWMGGAGFVGLGGSTYRG